MPFGTYSLNDGNHIPAIAYGTGSVLKFTDVTTYVEQALDTGFCHLDTAAYYHTEGGVGAGIKESGLDRKELYVTTKFGGRTADITQEVQVSLSNLGLEYIDLYLIHNPFFLGPDWVSEWRKMEQAKEDGYVKSIGVSNFQVDQLQKIVKIAKILPAVNQIPVDPYNYATVEPTIAYCKKNNILVEAYSSLSPITAHPGGPVDSVIEKIGEARNATPAQVLQLWVLSKGIVIVTTSTRRERLKEYLAVADLSPLTAEEIEAIEEAGAKGPPASGPGFMVKHVDDKKLVVGIMVLFMIAFFMFVRRQGCH